MIVRITVKDVDFRKVAILKGNWKLSIVDGGNFLEGVSLTDRQEVGAEKEGLFGDEHLQWQSTNDVVCWSVDFFVCYLSSTSRILAKYLSSIASWLYTCNVLVEVCFPPGQFLCLLCVVWGTKFLYILHHQCYFSIYSYGAIFLLPCSSLFFSVDPVTQQMQVWLLYLMRQVIFIYLFVSFIFPVFLYILLRSSFNSAAFLLNFV